MRIRKVWMKILYSLVAVFLSSSLVFGQDPRGAILGRVTDPSGASITGAKVEVVNKAMGVVLSSQTNEQGNYEIPYLIPGIYTVTIQATGFKRYMREEIEVRVGDRLALDVKLEIGQLSESVTVTGETPLLETSTAVLGQVADHRRIIELPLSGGNAMMLVRTAAGVTYTGAPNHPNLPAATDSVMAFTTGTAIRTTDYNVDGVSTMMGGRLPAFLPPADMVEEFKVDTASYDASSGHSAGSSINVILRSGTNAFHGSLYHYHSNIVLQGLSMFQRQRLYAPGAGPVTHEREREVSPQFVINRPGGSIGGPVIIPRLYNGRNRTFWMYAFEMFLRPQVEPGEWFRTVPTLEQRQGDFSALLKLGAQYQIYDPATIAAAPAGRFSRQPFAGNVIPRSRLDPLAQRLLSLWPEPNRAGTPDQLQNYYYPTRSRNDFYTQNARIDHVISDRHRISGRWNRAHQDFMSAIVLPGTAVGNYARKPNRTWGLDDVYTISPRTVLNMRYNFSRHWVKNEPISRGFDLAGAGFSQRMAALVPKELSHFPSLNFDNLTGIGGGAIDLSVTNYHTSVADVMWMHGNHNLRFGGDYRLFREHYLSYQNMVPAYSFNQTWTRGPLDNSPTALVGQGLASFLLGLPSGGSGRVNASSAEQSWYMGIHVQDNWKVNRRLTLNIGLRYEYEGPLTERFDRTIRGFDFTVTNPIDAAARANYAKNPIPEVPVSSFRAMGGVLFAGVGGQPRGLWVTNKKNFSPRLGLAYQFSDKTVVRSGYGIFFNPQGADSWAVRQVGFSRTTSLVPSNDNGLTFVATLADPFPNGYLPALGSSLGLNANVGDSIAYFSEHLPHAYTQRWSFGIQQQLPGKWVIDTSYVGNRSTRLAVNRQLNAVPANYLSTLPERDQRTIDFLSARVANPFYPILQGTGLAGNTVPRSQLLQPYPHFTGLSTDEPIGFSWYHSLQMKVERRFSQGFTVQITYTWSKFMEAMSFLNTQDAAPQKQVAASDRPQVMTFTGIYELPFGPGKTFAAGARGAVKQLVAGWQMQGIYEGQSGPPVTFGNVIFRGDLHDLVLPIGERSPSRWFHTEAGFERDSAKQLASNLRTFPTRLTGLRAHGLNIWNISVLKNFQITEHVRFQLRSEWLNAMNHTHLAAPNTSPVSTLFGQVTAALGWQRQIYFVGRLTF